MCTLWIQIFPEKEQKNTPVIIPQSYFRTKGTGGYIDVPNHGLDFRSFEKKLPLPLYNWYNNDLST
jgi:hypothetical protein